MKLDTWSIFAVIVVVFFSARLTAQDSWPQFRGAGASGVATGTPPTTWDVDNGTNIAWKTRIEGLGHSSPIIWGDHVFVTTAVSAETDSPSVATGWQGGTGEAAADNGQWTWKVVCLDRTSGNIRWSKSAISRKPTIERHMKATHANSTPATDGEHVVAFFGSEGLYCYDFDGQLKWNKDFGHGLHSGPYDADELEWGFASSPVIHNGMVIVQCDCLNTGFVSVLDLANGDEIRRINREEVSTWSTPSVFNWKGRTQIVCNGFKEMAGYDLDSGQRSWTLSGGGDVPVPTPLFHDGLIYLSNSHAGSHCYAISPDATDDITPQEGKDLPVGMAWHEPRGGSYMPTPIIVGNFHYTCNDNGVLSVREAKTGEQIYQQRVAKGSNVFSASAVATKDHVYFTGERGNVIVIRTGREFERVATNELSGVVMATPAIAGDELFFRTTEDLICVATASATEE